jgi:hypothetical protein
MNIIHTYEAYIEAWPRNRSGVKWRLQIDTGGKVTVMVEQNCVSRPQCAFLIGQCVLSLTIRDIDMLVAQVGAKIKAVRGPHTAVVKASALGDSLRPSDHIRPFEDCVPDQYERATL